MSPRRKRTIPEDAAKNAVFYLRVSSAGQVNTDFDPEGISIPAQRVSCQRKADQLGLKVVDEYVEPGRSATEMTKRVRFQEMMRRIKRERDVAYVIVYKLSRMNRNRLDDAFVMADLQSWGTSLISATENIDESPEGQLMHGMLAAFNQYRSQSDGADIRYKMGEKIKRGGTVGRAPLGYRNTRVEYEGRQVNTVEVDEVRAPLIKMAWSLYATGEYSLERLQASMADQGLTTRSTANRPPQPVSLNKLHQMLRDPYYTGVVTYQGQTYPGRHEALVSPALFERVQEVLASRSQNGLRDRIHAHYLKGVLFCDRCYQRQRTSRLIYTEATGHAGKRYSYFVCRGRQDGVCDLRHLPVWQVEQYIEQHYPTVQLPDQFIAGLRVWIAKAMDDEQRTLRELHASVKRQLARLDAQEEGLLDLLADRELATDRVRVRLRKLQAERQSAEDQLTDSDDQLAQGADILRRYLNLLDEPARLYLQSPDNVRRLLNDAFFERLYLDDLGVGHDERTRPLLDIQRVAEATPEEPNQNRPDAEVGSFAGTVIGPLGGSIDAVNGSNRTVVVELRGIEPRTSSMRTKRATNCATAPRPRREPRPRLL